MKRKKCQSGIDGINFEYTLAIEGIEHITLDEKELKNDNGRTITSLKCVNGKLIAYVNTVHCIRPDNIQPFGIIDSIRLEMVRLKVVEFMKDYLKCHLAEHPGTYSDEYVNYLKVTSLECNITLPCEDGATPTDVIHLFDLAYDQTIVHRDRRVANRCKKVNNSFFSTKSKYYRIKVYDKTAEQRTFGILHVPKNLLRIELVFIDRSLDKLFGKGRRLEDVLTEYALIKVCKEYKRIFEEDIVEGRLKPYLDLCCNEILESLKEFESEKMKIHLAVAKHKEYIPDIEVLRHALKRWYKARGMDDNSKQVIQRYRENGIGLPEGVLETVKRFHIAAG